MKSKLNDNQVLFLKKALITIILSIIASALWENLISSLFSRFFSFVHNVFEHLGLSISNNIYSKISNGFNEEYSLYTYTLLILVVLLVILSTIVSSRSKLQKQIERIIQDPSKDTSTPENFSNMQQECDDLKSQILEDIKVIKKSFIFLYITTAILCLCSVYEIGEAFYINTLTTNTIANIEIVSPHISDIEYKQLKSNFYSIESKADYDALMTSISNIANDNHLQLKK